MRVRFATLALLALAPIAAASAEGVFQTHAEQGISGKTPTKAYRPLVQDKCRTATNHHQTGKIPLTPQVSVSSTCQTELAARDSAERTGFIDGSSSECSP